MIPAGLCASCRWKRDIITRTATYVFCRRSEADPMFPRYPALPVRSCAGHEPPAPDDEGARPPV